MVVVFDVPIYGIIPGSISMLATLYIVAFSVKMYQIVVKLAFIVTARTFSRCDCSQDLYVELMINLMYYSCVYGVGLYSTYKL